MSTETITLAQALNEARTRPSRCNLCQPFYCDTCGWEAETAFAADVVAFRKTADGPEVLLITRKYPPYQTCLALPGGYVDPADADEVDDPTDEVSVSAVAAAREAREETRLPIITPAHLQHVGRYDAPDRDPRGRRISNAYTLRVPAATLVEAGDDASSVQWVSVETALSAKGWAFDHGRILRDALAVA